MEKLPQINYVKPAKQKDVKNLMRFFTVPDNASEFYKDIFKSNDRLLNAEDVLEDESGIPLYNNDTV